MTASGEGLSYSRKCTSVTEFSKLDEAPVADIFVVGPRQSPFSLRGVCWIGEDGMKQKAMRIS